MAKNTKSKEVIQWMNETEAKIKELMADKTDAEIAAYIRIVQNKILEIVQGDDSEEIKKLSIKLLKYQIHCMEECIHGKEK